MINKCITSKNLNAHEDVRKKQLSLLCEDTSYLS